MNKCKIGLCDWPKLQITLCDIKNNLYALKVRQNKSLLHKIKFH